MAFFLFFLLDRPDKISMIQKDLDKTDTSLQNITDYYLQHVWLNLYETEQFKLLFFQ